ncbi:MAG: formate dehydrogenase accessory sulfurtransferase FdhD [Pyrinomonas sp.]|uniref:formate dehydrogenase accessory sulfurtransferase FdhD n=1 Tax=Pyrinomonas sp. TaxID=2080306 RepID=UPI003333841E
MSRDEKNEPGAADPELWFDPPHTERSALPATRVRILEVRQGQARFRQDEVATEEPMEIRLLVRNAAGWKRHSISITMRTPGQDFELAAGFLLTEGVITDRQAIERITYCVDPDERQRQNIVNVYLSAEVSFDLTKLTRHVYTSSSCGICGKASLELVRAVCPRRPVGEALFTPEYFLALPAAQRQAQRLFSRTGGLHATALFDAQGRLKLLREDVGRHNAMDKLIGALLLQDGLPASNTTVLVSGRASFELVQKALMAGIPTLAAVGAPSSLAIELAREFGMTLVGFLRDDRFNVYAGGERVRSPHPPSPARDHREG